MIPVLASLASLGIGFIGDLVKEHGEDLVKEGVKKVTGIDLNKKELTPAEVQQLKDNEYRIMELDFKKVLEANRHEEKYEELKVSDKQDARKASHLHEMQTEIAGRIYEQTKVIIPLLLVTDVLISLLADVYELDTAIVVGVSNLIGIALNNAYRERQSILEFLFGSSVGSKLKDK